MALEPGGYADKLGNKYELRWVVKQLLRLLNEEIISLTYEPVGEDEIGVDLWILKKDRQKEAHQCKSENGKKTNWSIADLYNSGILTNIIYQLDRSYKNFFIFVSGTPANMLRDLSRSAKDSNNPNDFLKYQVKVSRNKFKAFNQFCQYLNLNTNIQIDLNKAVDYLKRVNFHLFTNDYSSYEELKSYFSILFTGSAEIIISLLSDYLIKNLRKEIILPDVIKFLKDNGYYQRIIKDPDRILPRINELKMQFEESIKPNLISGNIIPREESKEIISRIKQNNNEIVILHGKAGQGKSGILYEICKYFEKEGIFYLPIRLDRKEIKNNSIEFGKSLGLQESPIKILNAIAGNRKSVLLLDQLDALRWTSTHSSNALDVCRTLIFESQSINLQQGNVSIILSCRTYDLENNPGIKSLLNISSHSKSFKIKVSNLSQEVISKVLLKYKINYNELNEKQKNILGNPFYLSLLETVLKTSNREKIKFITSTDIMKLFWENRYREIQKSGLKLTECTKLISEMCNYLQQKNQLWVPARLFNSFPDIISLLKSLNIIQESENKINFSHQSFLDYQIAQNV